VIGAIQRCAEAKPLEPVAWLQKALKAAPMPEARKPAWVADREAREARGAEWAGPFAARKLPQSNPLEVIDADGKLLG
jgi:hypothetical protein